MQDRDLGSVAGDVRQRAGRFPVQAAQGQLLRNPRPGRDHADILHRPGRRAGVRGRAGVFRHGGQLPILARSVHYSDGPARRALGHPADALRHPDHHQCSVADGRYHEHWSGHGEQHPAGELRQRRARAPAPTQSRAALEAGYTRLRPVIMTALAMIVGMLPMALGIGEGGEQNAPLGRAVIGGLLLATVATLFFVPVVYSVLRRNPPTYLEHEAEVEAYDQLIPRRPSTTPRRTARSPRTGRARPAGLLRADRRAGGRRGGRRTSCRASRARRRCWPPRKPKPEQRPLVEVATARSGPRARHARPARRHAGAGGFAQFRPRGWLPAHAPGGLWRSREGRPASGGNRYARARSADPPGARHAVAIAVRAQ